MKLSVIIPTFNSGAVIKKALDSIVCQTFADWEVLVMDGASTDNTLEVARSFGDNRIRFFSEPDKGIYDAMNKGIKTAQGEWLYFLGSDDWLLNKEVLQSVFSDDIDQYDVVYGDVVAEHLLPCHKGEWSVEKINYNRCHQAIFYKASAFSKNGLYDIKYPILADYAFNLKWFLKGNLKSNYIKREIAHFSEDGISNRVVDEAFMRDYGFMIIKYGHAKVPANIQKGIVRESIRYNSDRFFARLVLSLYVYYLRVKHHGFRHHRHL